MILIIKAYRSIQNIDFSRIFSFDKVDPRPLVVDGGLLVVSLQHRLGALGFLPLNKVQVADVEGGGVNEVCYPNSRVLVV